ncbi:cytosine permease [Komagataeibacter rhaeticus]|nr:cytosine permease [Komagataeibacter rhaeticus]
MTAANWAATDGIGHIETHGAAPIPENERHGRPSELALIFWQPDELCFPAGRRHADCHGAVSSGRILGHSGRDRAGGLCRWWHGHDGAENRRQLRHDQHGLFGARGRYVGSVIIQMIDLGYFAMGLWVGAPQFLKILNIMMHVPETPGWMVFSILTCGILVVVVALLGHATIVFYEKLVSFSGIAIIALILVCVIMHPTGHFDPAGVHKTANPAALWVLSASYFLANAISYAPFAGDYTRYMPASTPSFKLFMWTAFGMIAGCMLALSSGMVIGLRVTDPFDVTQQMVGSLPSILILPVTIIAVAANTCNGAMVVYNGVLNLNAILHKWRRVNVAYLFGTLGIALGYVGLVIMKMSDSIMALCSIVTMLVTPWITINIIGYFHARGWFDVPAIRSPGPVSGRSYWYVNGYNLPAVFAWVLGILFGMPFRITVFLLVTSQSSQIILTLVL